MDPLPVLTEYTEEERQISELQLGFAARLRRSQYYVVEPSRSTGESQNQLHSLMWFIENLDLILKDRAPQVFGQVSAIPHFTTDLETQGAPPTFLPPRDL